MGWPNANDVQLQPLRLNFDADHVKRLRELAAEQDRSISWTVRQMVAAGLEKWEAERRRGQPAA